MGDTRHLAGSRILRVVLPAPSPRPSQPCPSQLTHRLHGPALNLHRWRRIHRVTLPQTLREQFARPAPLPPAQGVLLLQTEWPSEPQDTEIPKTDSQSVPRFPGRTPSSVPGAATLQEAIPSDSHCGLSWWRLSLISGLPELASGRLYHGLCGPGNPLSRKIKTRTQRRTNPVPDFSFF